MANFLGTPSVDKIRWIARILGCLVGRVGLFGTIQGFGDCVLERPSGATTSGLLVWVGFILVFAGWFVGWIKEFGEGLRLMCRRARRSCLERREI